MNPIQQEDTNEYDEKPRYLKAITENNRPRYDWGPKRAANHQGPYAHLTPKQPDFNETNLPTDIPSEKL